MQQLSDLDFNNTCRPINLLTPINPGDATNKAYVDTYIGTLPNYSQKIVIPNGVSYSTGSTTLSDLPTFSLTTHPTDTYKYLILLNAKLGSTSNSRSLLFDLRIGGVAVERRECKFLFATQSPQHFQAVFFHQIPPNTIVKIQYAINTTAGTVSVNSSGGELSGFSLIATTIL